jgi:hypothetical protein
MTKNTQACLEAFLQGREVRMARERVTRLRDGTLAWTVGKRIVAQRHGATFSLVTVHPYGWQEERSNALGRALSGVQGIVPGEPPRWWDQSPALTPRTFSIQTLEQRILKNTREVLEHESEYKGQS